MNNSKFWLITGLILLAVISRILPFHINNFTPLIAVALFAGAKFDDKKWSILIPIVSLFISDAILAYQNHYALFHDTIFFTYSSILLIIFLGRTQLMGKLNIAKTFGVTLVSSLIFFVISNLGVWFFGNMYSLNFSGLMQCYIMAIPFNKFSWLGDLVFTFILFGTYEYVSNKYFTSVKNTALIKSDTLD